MKLGELFEMMCEGTNIRVTVDGAYVVAYYDGRNSIDDEYNDYEVNHFFATTIGGEPYISVDTNSRYRIEIWHNYDTDDWAQVSIDKSTGSVETIISGYWDCPDTMTYKEAIEFLAEYGYTEHDTAYDSYESWEEYNDYISADSPYDYMDSIRL